EKYNIIHSYFPGATTSTSVLVINNKHIRNTQKKCSRSSRKFVASPVARGLCLNLFTRTGKKWDGVRRTHAQIIRAGNQTSVLQSQEVLIFIIASGFDKECPR